MNLKKYDTFLNEKNEFFRIKNLISVPDEIDDIFQICHNEIQLSNNDVLITMFYTRVYFLCLMQFYNLTLGYVDIISDVRNSIVLSDDVKDMKLQYKRITDPKHILPASMLKMLNGLKEIFFINKDLKKFNTVDIISNLLIEIFTGDTRFPQNFRKLLLNSKIEIK